jgi:ribosomal protein L24E
MKEITIDGVVYVPKEEIKYAESTKKWEPKEGLFYVSSDGNVYYETSNNKQRMFGTEFANREIAEKAAKEMRRFNRLIAYKMEFCPGYEPDWNNESELKYGVFYKHDIEKWALYNEEYGGVAVYFPREVAEELVRRLNSGIVTL